MYLICKKISEIVITRNVSETLMPPMVQNSGFYSLKKQNLYEASNQGVKTYKVDNTLGSKE